MIFRDAKTSTLTCSRVKWRLLFFFLESASSWNNKTIKIRVNLFIKSNFEIVKLRKSARESNLSIDSTFSAGKGNCLLLFIVGVWFGLLWGNELGRLWFRRGFVRFSVDSLSLFGVCKLLVLRRHCWVRLLRLRLKEKKPWVYYYY